MSVHDISGFDPNDYPYLNRGLEGIVAFSTTKSFIDGQKGDLIYSGYNIHTLAEHATFEEVCHLLWHDRLPNRTELEDLKTSLSGKRHIPESVKAFIRSAPASAEPMSVLRSAVSMLADHRPEPTGDETDDILAAAVDMTAKIPTIIAAFDRVRHGREILEPLGEGGTAEEFLYMLNGEKPGEAAIRTMDLCLVLHAEHGMNASTFATRAIASTLSDIYSAVTGAIGSLKGPLHGGANTAVMNMLLDMMEKGSDLDVAAEVRGKLARKEKIMGFGHRVYKTFDPRAVHLQKMAKSLSEETGHEQLYDWSMTILDTLKKEKNLDPNVDFFSATVYYSIGIQPDLYTAIFAMSRISGWSAHYMEQWENNRLIRPRSLYIAAKNLDWVPIDER